MNHDFVDKIWIPDIYIYDLKSFKQKENLKEQSGISINRTSGNLVVQYYFQSEIGFICPIDYANFPFHKPTCLFKLSAGIEYNDTLIFKVQYYSFRCQ